MQIKNIIHLYIIFTIKIKLAFFRPYSDFIVILHCTTPGSTAHLIVDVSVALTDV